MNKENLPKKVDPFRFAEHALSLEGTLPLNNMERLCTSLNETNGGVNIKIEFGIDEQGIRFVQGHLSACLVLQCQRCMEPFKYEILGNFLSGLVRTEEEADRLPGRYDPLVVADASLVISDLVEEELIVSLPIVPMHNQASCKVALPFVSGRNSQSETEKDNPFKVIELLRSKRDK